MQINSLSTLKSLPSLLLFVILSTAQTYHPISTNILINNSPIVRMQKAYFLETPHFGSTTQYNMNRNTIRFILAVSAEHRRYNNILYNIFYYIQICGVIRTRRELSDSLRRILSEQRPEKTCRKKKKKNSAGNVGRIHGSCPEKPVLRRLHGWKDFDSNYLRCHALLTAFHFPLETTWSCKQYRKERYWGQQFWQMHGKGHFGPTDRNDQNGHSRPPSKLVPNIPVGPNRNGLFHLSWGANRNYRNFGLNGKRPTSGKRPQKFHTDDASLPRSEWCSRLV